MSDSVHDQPDYERVYDEDDMVQVRRGDLRALLDLATGSMDFGSGFWDDEQVEIARKVAGVLNIDPMLATPSNFTFKYGCRARGEHKWRKLEEPWILRYGEGPSVKWICDVCRHTSTSDEPSNDMNERPQGQS